MKKRNSYCLVKNRVFHCFTYFDIVFLDFPYVLGFLVKVGKFIVKTGETVKQEIKLK